MNYREALEFLESPSRFSPKLGLERIRAFLKALGSPENCFPSVLVAGTSGKGSSCKMIQSVLTKAGYRVGLFTKPHLQSYRERVAIGDELISPQDLTRLVEKVVPAAQLEKPSLGFPTYFEMGVALAFQYFAWKKVDLAVVEVGMGGRLDATNVLAPEITGITEVGFDHMEYLGETLAQIAKEKAGIIKSGIPLVLSSQFPEAMQVLEKRAWELKAPLYFSGSKEISLLSWNLKGQTFNLSGNYGPYEGLFLPLLGEHQLRNAAFALTVLELLLKAGYTWSESHLREGWAHLEWPGRLEVLSSFPVVAIDGAHNPNKAEALAQALKKYFRFRKLILVLGVSKDKDFSGILNNFIPMGPLVITTQARSERARPASELKEICEKAGLASEAIPEVKAALFRALEIAQDQDLVLVTGSIYVAGEARDLYFPLE